MSHTQSIPILLVLLHGLLPAQEWPAYAGDSGGSKYSSLKQINRGNVARLKVAWTYHTGDLSDGSQQLSRSAFEGTPLVIDGVMYVTTPFNRLIALEAETGKQLWAFDPKLDKERPVNLFISRGSAWWSSGARQRLFLGTLDGRLFSIDAKTGKPDDSFGKAGWIDLRQGVADKYPNPIHATRIEVELVGMPVHEVQSIRNNKTNRFGAGAGRRREIGDDATARGPIQLADLHLGSKHRIERS